MNNPLVGLAVPHRLAVADAKSPKSSAFPVDAIVINSI